jgi:hypothetical protein
MNNVAEALKRQKIAKLRQSFKEYEKLIRTPSSLGSVGVNQFLTTYSVPASIEFAVSFSVQTTESPVQIIIGNRTVMLLPSVAHRIFKLGYLFESSKIKIKRLADSPSGTIKLYVYSRSSIPYVIATGNFT